MKSLYTDSLAHTTWECKYHIVFAPSKLWKKAFEDYRKAVNKMCQWAREGGIKIK